MQYISFDCSGQQPRLDARNTKRFRQVRNARARKKIERKRDQEQLRKNIEEVWN